jgi:26S proteasome regulatory subunit T6
MGKTKVLVKVNPEGKYVVDIDKDIDINKCLPNTRVALRNDSYTLHLILPTKVPVLFTYHSENCRGSDLIYMPVGGSVGEPHEGGKGPGLYIRHGRRARQTNS